jgi:hypothetical protein
LPGGKPAKSSAQQSHGGDGSALKRGSLDATATWYGDEDDDEDGELMGEVERDDPLDGAVEDTTMMMMMDWTDDAAPLEAVALPGLMMLDDFPSNEDNNNVLMTDDAFLSALASPMRVECCWDQLEDVQDDNRDDGTRNRSPELGRKSPPRVLRTHSSSSSTASSSSSSVSTPQLTLQEIFEQRRAQLEASMERSRESRKYLEKHIQQRASLASVLADIERSSRQIIVEVLSSNDAASNDEEGSGDDGASTGEERHETVMVQV